MVGISTKQNGQPVPLKVMAFIAQEKRPTREACEVAGHLNLDWKTVKGIDIYYLEHEYGQPDLNGLKVLAVDEISVRKGHQYLTVVLDYFCSKNNGASYGTHAYPFRGGNT